MPVRSNLDYLNLIYIFDYQKSIDTSKKLVWGQDLIRVVLMERPPDSIKDQKWIFSIAGISYFV